MFLRFTQYYMKEEFYLRQKDIVAIRPNKHKTFDGDYQTVKDSCIIETNNNRYVVKGSVDDILKIVDGRMEAED